MLPQTDADPKNIINDMLIQYGENRTIQTWLKPSQFKKKLQKSGLQETMPFA